jgi:hypothetical protein
MVANQVFFAGILMKEGPETSSFKHLWTQTLEWAKKNSKLAQLRMNIPVLGGEGAAIDTEAPEDWQCLEAMTERPPGKDAPHS